MAKTWASLFYNQPVADHSHTVNAEEEGLHGSGCGCEQCAWAIQDSSEGYEHYDLAPLSPEELRERLEDLSSKAPRFLFRLWSPTSGGNLRLNSHLAITPHAFLNSSPNAPKSIHNLKETELTSFIQGHLGGSHVNTVFSSWTQSLDYILTWVNDDAATGTSSNHCISVVDTTKLSHENLVLFTRELENVLAIGGYEHEYSTFGVITTHRTISVRELYPASDLKGLARFGYPSVRLNMPDSRDNNSDPGATVQTPGDVERLVSVAHGTTYKLGRDLELAMVAYLLTNDYRIDPLSNECRKWVINSLLRQMRVPDDWTTCERFADTSHGYWAYSEVDRAMSLLRDIIEAHEARKSKPSWADTAR